MVIWSTVASQFTVVIVWLAAGSCDASLDHSARLSGVNAPDFILAACCQRPGYQRPVRQRSEQAEQPARAGNSRPGPLTPAAQFTIGGHDQAAAFSLRR